MPAIFIWCTWPTRTGRLSLYYSPELDFRGFVFLKEGTVYFLTFPDRSDPIL